jgi:hypothetical protein
MAYWNAISNSKKASDYQSYLHQFPNGTFASLAKSRLADLGAPVQAPAAAQPAAASSAVTKSQAELKQWTSISESQNPEDYRAFLSQYPSGTYAPLARSRLATLQMSTSTPTQRTPSAITTTSTSETSASSPAAEQDSGEDADDDQTIEYADTADHGGKRKDRNRKSHKGHH